MTGFRRCVILCTGGGLIATAIVAARHRHKYPAETTVPDPNARDISQVDLLHDPQFAFSYAEGGVWFNVLKLDAAGNAVYLFDSIPSTPGHLLCKRAAFTCDSATMHDLRQLLADMRITQLAIEYHNGTADGYQRILHLTLTEYQKRIYWDNDFPAATCGRLKTFIGNRILAPHAAQLHNTPTTAASHTETAILTGDLTAADR